MNAIKKLFLLITLFTIHILSAQSTDDILNLLIHRGFIKQTEADSIRTKFITKQQELNTNKIFTIDLQMKNRLEYRNGYGNIPSDNSYPSTFVNQRSRLIFDYTHVNSLNSVISIQDARVWGSHDPRGLNGTLQLFEGYIESFINPNFSIRIGRQRIAYDNQRLFAENEWRINGASHDAINFKYKKNKLNTELVAAFNQTGERNFGTDYTPAELSITPSSSTPSSWTNYKALIVNYLKYDFKSNFIGTTILAADAYQDAIQKEQNYWRYTYGGRFEYNNKKWYATVSSYLQNGRNNTGQTIKAWYIQPEIKYSFTANSTIRLGAELISGDNGNIGQVDHNFVPIYGVAHRFNGFMDLFIKFPNDISNTGLVNPYLYINKKLSDKVDLNSNSHLFYTQRGFVNSSNIKLNKYMGYEHDLLLIYKPNTITHIEGGFSIALPTDTMTAVKKTGNSEKIASWAYVQVKFTPRLFKSNFN